MPEFNVLRRSLWCLAAAILALSICESNVMAQSKSTSELTVFAAASLTEAFQQLAKDFEGSHSGTNVRFNFGGSQQLVQQIAHGAPFDVFASANAKQMDLAMTTGRIDSASVKIFARNHLVVVVPRDNPARISSLVDLAQANLKIVLADKSVPAGQYAVDVLGKCAKSAGFPSAFKEAVIRNVVSYEENVKAVLSKIVLGEADAGIVYASDISRDSTHRVGQIVIPDSLNVIAEYPIAAAGETGASAAAKEFVGYVCSGKGQKILRLFGFSEPKE